MTAEPEINLPMVARAAYAEMGPNEAGARTVVGYLTELLAELWSDPPKRMFGNSAWQYAVYKALIKAGLVDGKLDEEGDVEKLDTKAADRLVREVIDSLGMVP